MSKRNTNRVTVLSAFALTTLCLLSAVTSAQKGPQGTASSVRPVRGIDVIVKKDPGNTAARTATTNEKGEVEFVGLEPGNYSLTIADATTQRPANAKLGLRIDDLSADREGVAADNYEVAIVGAVGGPIKREWNAKEKKFATPSNATARATTAPRYEDRINFEIGGGDPSPVLTTIIKSRSNVRNN